ncbi:hypothetical protein [Umezawaea sp.]|uniref:alpha/beta fold hydrolase n=1 Tax=Umezawaea sp. TaxID=1955258 RepID=UPI002ED1E1FF
MATAVTSDGYRLWYEATGDGPAVVFPARFRAEQAALGDALAADGRRVVRYKPRQVVGVLEPEEDAGGPWNPTALTRYPLDMEVDDLHTVADAAGVDTFVLAGYSGMAALAGFLVAASDRATGLLIGGFPLLAGYDYWLGYVEGARGALRQAGLPEKAAEHHAGVLLYQDWTERDDTAALTALPGPKVLWYGSRDGEPDCRMHDVVGGSAIARRVRAHAEPLRRAGFELIEFDGLDHIGALASTDVIAPRLSGALADAGW